MKNKPLTILIMFFALISAFSLSGCFIDNDEDIAKQNLDMLITAIHNQDISSIKTFFAPKKIESIENFDIKIEDLFNYCQGEYIPSKNEVGPMTEKSKEGEIIVKYQMTQNWAFIKSGHTATIYGL